MKRSARLPEGWPFEGHCFHAVPIRRVIYLKTESRDRTCEFLIPPLNLHSERLEGVLHTTLSASLLLLLLSAKYGIRYHGLACFPVVFYPLAPGKAAALTALPEGFLVTESVTLPATVIEEEEPQYQGPRSWTFRAGIEADDCPGPG